MFKRRVVITGLGVVAANGIGRQAFWQANIEGKSGVAKITAFDASGLDSQICAPVKDFQHLNYILPEDSRKIDRFVHLGLAAAKTALDDSKLALERVNKERIGVIIGSGLGGVLFHEEQIMAGYEKGLHRLNARCVPRITPNAVASHIAIQYGCLGPNMVISNACASGTHAVGEAFRHIQNNEMDLCLSGGVEAPLTPFTFGAYDALKVLSRRNDSPEAASRPFDKERDGFVLGEGGAVLVLEELKTALKRNAHIYAELIGYGAGSGAYHIVMPEPTGSDAARCMRNALADARVKPKDIDYINAHGTSTTLNDKAETQGIKEVFAEYAYKIPISSTKSMIGHSIGAAGAIEALVCALVIENNLIPPTINYQYPDPDCDLDYVPNQARGVKVDIALSNSFGFGNSNACLVFKRYK
ncbi:MAG: beta-ketoacyl-ACP synthase II [Candidatus Omnitrophica bacterium]|nr:beta-ketoacyl-ACP synthase II [Candidatus Omnitrophota bacterium]